MVGMGLTHWDLELVDECWSPRSFYRVNWGPGLADFSFFGDVEKCVAKRRGGLGPLV